LAIQEIGKFDCLVNGIPSSEYPTLQDPPFSLDKSKIKNIFGVEVPAYKVSLSKCGVA
jgi:dTDP-4-dehydrorhamnose reductase